MGILIIIVILFLLVVSIIESIRKWYVNREYRERSKLTQEEKELVSKQVQKLESYYNIKPNSFNISQEIVSFFASYPHGFAYLAMKHLYVRVGGVDMPTSYFDEQGNADSTLYLASCTMKYFKDIKELSHSQMITLLSFSDDFEAKEKYVLQQLEYNKISLEFNNKIKKDVLRSKYYIEFLNNHYITNPKLIKSKQYCLNNIVLFDSFICQKEKKKEEKEREFYKLCEDLNLNIFNEKEYRNECFTRIINSVSSWKLKIKGIPYYFFYHYYPTRFTDISNASRNVRGLIYDFKEGKRHGNVVNILSQKLRSTFHHEDFKHLCLVCIPASNVRDNNCRYREFAENLCSTLGMSNGFEHIKITKEKTKSHLGGTDSAEYYIDGNFFKDKNVILFDDVVTRGRSMQVFKELLEDKGATVICALSIGRTYSDYYGDHREPHPWTNEY